MEKTLKVLTYNVDGLPEKLDLNDLPWLLKPIAWIYKLIKGTTIITINDNNDKNEDFEKISKYLSNVNADIIGVQEDFNYHDTLIGSLEKNYSCGTHLGGFDISKVFSNTEWITHFPLPRFKCDGINVISRKNFSNEKIESWKTSYGYFTHANDLLTHKGFRYYLINLGEDINVDLYILHMDADFYNPETCPNVTKDLNARKIQLNQLVKNIKKSNTNNPIIIMGDTNSYDKYEWDKANIQENLIDAINNTDNLNIQESVPTNYSDCDKIFFINNKNSKYKLELKDCYFDMDMSGISDHMPLIAIFNIK